MYSTQFVDSITPHLLPLPRFLGSSKGAMLHTPFFCLGYLWNYTVYMHPWMMLCHAMSWETHFVLTISYLICRFSASKGVMKLVLYLGSNNIEICHLQARILVLNINSFLFLIIVEKAFVYGFYSRKPYRPLCQHLHCQHEQEGHRGWWQKHQEWRQRVSSHDTSIHYNIWHILHLQ